MTEFKVRAALGVAHESDHRLRDERERSRAVPLESAKKHEVEEKRGASAGRKSEGKCDKFIEECEDGNGYTIGYFPKDDDE